ncbi:MAG: 23S rRNA (uracil(1939)-C(5))-methyltransferase RlmD [Candidatus Abyssobacteria bacterium SURF_5]|uniref:23S rRNA (Uracil(1939)-C(5))-methyltransferase RlmD n=1 Tax=Abyssobacteria bacterium (strain SURF_5) TaxID=2093360 RepID=A0A3A4PCK4_ABYX5|nr:MAG: 23S rRNA (uracil(1939)-C(5))-methyltransferase RlmD [Candidatus Abyssubacteria bacterium SURF_5]
MQIHKIKIEKIVSGGYGLGRLDGRVVLVPYGAPGDEALIEVAPARKGVLWGTISQMIDAAPSRVDPFCAHYGRCGGCQIQHLSYPHQLECKRQFLEEALRRIAGICSMEAFSCSASPAHTGYRSRVRFHYDKGRVGFFTSRSHEVIPLKSCPMLTDGINRCLEQFGSFVSDYPLPGLSEIQITEDADARVILTLNVNVAPEANVIERFQKSLDVAGAVAKAGSRIIPLWGEQYSNHSVEGKNFRVGPDSFFQANTLLLPALVHEAMKAISRTEISYAVELYAGVGVFSLFLSEKVRKLVAVEANRSAAEDAAHNLIDRKNVEIMPVSAEDALDLLTRKGAKPELVLLDPPREGLSTAARRKLLQMAPRQVVYISCDPATLARDAKMFVAGGYRLETAKPLDMFPHTAHVESVCSFVRS